MDSYFVEKINQKQGTVYLPHALYQKELSKVTFSTKTVLCTFRASRNNKCYFSEDIWQALGIPFAQKWTLYIHEDTLYFLPIIGLFTTQYNKSTLRPFGERTEQFKQLLQLTKAHGGCAYLFTTEHIHWENGLIRGIVYHDHQWQEQTLPFPQLVYDRTPNRRAERLTMVKDIKQRFQQDYGIPWFNPQFFNKWDIHTRLQGHPLASQYLPKTYPLTEKYLKTALSNFTTVYIKPKKSSHGVGIKRVTALDHGKITCQTNTIDGSYSKQYPSLKHFLVSEFQDHPTEHYFLQQGIPLKTKDGKPFDFRIHTNKDGQGQWQVSACAIKIADPSKITTHNQYGGEIHSLVECLGKEKAKVYYDFLKEEALTLSQILDEQIKDLIGELGLDLGIDEDNRVWLFEINARPGKVIFHHPKIRKQEKYVNHYWIDYCTYLVKLSIQKPLWFVEAADLIPY
ncbi:hypothetical protein JOD43_003588 [Pullulanibacillus pueri]|uniref:Endospore coat-associated protein YheD n=1 Tax=Pullulanibacillus pueri TaxID=1437324 RepID=A0A8J2ZZS8_9BACL|nr:YheC/YheD family protein [Pullulanibacillus pueri]MBM7683408.1 hypothetical protein [Pullulanibacillus pueri]GGH88039.1 endospore coat-associated protein YheD [Pullulanibacillus pueri]